MSDTEFKKARIKAGLTVSQAAELLAVTPVAVRRYEMADKPDQPPKKSARTAPPLTIKVLNWYANNQPPRLPDMGDE